MDLLSELSPPGRRTRTGISDGHDEVLECLVEDENIMYTNLGRGREVDH